MNTTTSHQFKVSRNMNREALRVLRNPLALSLPGEAVAGRIIARAYMADMLAGIEPDAYEATAETDREKVAFFLDCFAREFWHKGESVRAGAKCAHHSAWPGYVAKGIKSYLQGLPSCLPIHFYNSEMLDDAREKGFSIPANLEGEFVDAIWYAYGYAIVRLAEKFKVDLPTASGY